MKWYHFSLMSAVGWGLFYPLAGILLKKYSIPFLLFTLHLSSVLCFGILYFENFKGEFSKASLFVGQDALIFCILIFFTLSVNYVGYQGIAMKNATLAALLEVSYPLFSGLFAFFILKEAHMNLWSLLGSLFILGGVSLVVFSS